MKYVVWRHGVPAKIIHDEVAEFLTDVLQDIAAILGLKQVITNIRGSPTDRRVGEMF